MLFGKKEDKNKLPDLPAPRNNFAGNDNSLPSFPDSPNQRGFSQSAIKDAVSQEGHPMNQEQNRPKMVEMKEWSPSAPAFDDDEDDMPLPDTPPARMQLPPHHNHEEHNPIKSPPRPQMAKPKMETKGDVFVRIDKFNHARRALDKAQESLEQIDELVKKIRETKVKEDQELSSWENDILHVKARIKEVNETVFEKLE